MAKIEVELDDNILEQAQWMTKWQHCTLDELIAKALKQFAVAEAPNYPLLGLFADDPESVDEMLAEVMKDRAAHPLNQRFGREKN